MTIQVTEQFLSSVSCSTFYCAVHEGGCLRMEFVDAILKCGHSNESYLAVLSCGAVYYAVQGDSNF